MTPRTTAWSVSLLLAALIGVQACSDDDTTPAIATSSTSSGSGGMGGNGGSGGMGGSPLTCTQRCEGLFECGLEIKTITGGGGAGGGNTMPRCPGFAAGEGGGAGLTKTVFLDGEGVGGMGGNTGGCIQQCEGNMSFAKLIDPDDCAGTISTLKGVNDKFKNQCKGG